MFLVNLVRLLLLVGVMYEPGVDAAEHMRAQPSDLQKSILPLFEDLIKYSHDQDTKAVMTMVHPDAQVLMDGLPPIAGQKGIQAVVELITEKADRIENTFIDLQPMDEDANYVYVVFHFDFFNQSGDIYMDGSGLFLFRKTTDGYKFYITMFNKHNQSA